MFLSEVARVHARAARILYERNERAHLVDGKAELTTSADEGQPLDVSVSVHSLPSRPPIGSA
jgi:hypothetical protein